ncbi:hypothetical protein [Azospirillum aestuarii]|uniref:hypothetical protein n=1 Tax=Azospirillum aestuarii TaxID=2802052 RepID=UPI00405508F6
MSADNTPSNQPSTLPSHSQGEPGEVEAMRNRIAELEEELRTAAAVGNATRTLSNRFHAALLASYEAAVAARANPRHGELDTPQAVADLVALIATAEAHAAQAAAEQDRQKRRADEAEDWLNTLTARIHRDSGQHTAQHGPARSLADAERKVVEIYAEVDALKAALSAAEVGKAQLRKALKRVLDADKVLGHAKDRLATIKGASDQKLRNMAEWVRRATVAMESALTDARAVFFAEQGACICKVLCDDAEGKTWELDPACPVCGPDLRAWQEAGKTRDIAKDLAEALNDPAICNDRAAVAPLLAKARDHGLLLSEACDVP